jgi:hypothetical protein
VVFLFVLLVDFQFLGRLVNCLWDQNWPQIVKYVGNLVDILGFVLQVPDRVIFRCSCMRQILVCSYQIRRRFFHSWVNTSEILSLTWPTEVLLYQGVVLDKANLSLLNNGPLVFGDHSLHL